MRYSASDKTEIIRWSSNRLCRLDARWRSSAFPDRLYTAGMIGISAADQKPSRIAPHGPIGSGTASQRLSAARWSTGPLN
jgi:hypothetical protein